MINTIVKGKRYIRGLIVPWYIYPLLMGVLTWGNIFDRIKVSLSLLGNVIKFTINGKMYSQ